MSISSNFKLEILGVGNFWLYEYLMNVVYLNTSTSKYKLTFDGKSIVVKVLGFDHRYSSNSLKYKELFKEKKI